MTPVTFDESIVTSSDVNNYDDASNTRSEATNATDKDHNPHPKILIGPDWCCYAPMVHHPTSTQPVCNMIGDKCQCKGHLTWGS